MFGGFVASIPNFVNTQNAFTLYRHWSILDVLTTSSVRNVVRLKPEYNSRDGVLELVHRIAAYKKRSRAYRSRRFKAVVGSDEINDAIRLAESFD